jgi:hypothetical protein
MSIPACLERFDVDEERGFADYVFHPGVNYIPNDGKVIIEHLCIRVFRMIHTVNCIYFRMHR